MAIIPTLFTLAAVALYLAQWRSDGNRWVVAGGAAQATGLGAHFIAAAMDADFAPAPMHLGVFISLFMLATLLVSWRPLRSAILRRALLATAAAAALTPLWLPPAAAAPVTLHSILALAVYALAAAAFLLCLDLRLVEMQLRRQPPQGAAAAAPPLLQRERQYFIYVLLSFLLLTGTLVSGILTALAAGAPPFAFTHKQLFAYLTWGVFAALLAGRHFAGWRGRTAQGWFFAGYAFLLLSYLGSTVVVQFVIG